MVIQTKFCYIVEKIFLLTTDFKTTHFFKQSNFVYIKYDKNAYKLHSVRIDLVLILFFKYFINFIFQGIV